ncbi:BppU family phage baseplate upper protein [Brochothrix thermosphacta]|uniref:BppU family phage baseplate upper protein n=1 Tax=Brochothrix thermosphacta TaxID=2756 RepID=UPI001C4E76FB|nr:BppU family phage baseplate upper protein [Brochothrix thermosphacta]
MSITKISKSVMEVTADYQKLSDLNVAFYNQDINTAILQFNVTRNDAPVPLGKSNVDGYIVLLHEDGSRMQDNLVIEDEEHGVIQYTIPREFLKHTGKVLGQVYIAVKGRDDTAVMRKISFDIKQDLMTAFSSTKKLEYIKTFDDLQTQIKQRVEAIEEAIANGEDYVAQMVETLDTGKKEIVATVSKANTDINKVATDAKNSVTATANTAVATVNAKGDAVLKVFSENGQVPKITADTGAPRYDLNATKDLFAEILTWGNGLFTFYLSPGATNNPTVAASWLRGTATTYGKNSNVLAYDKVGTMYNVVCANGIWGSWEKTAMSSKTQNNKITEDTGQFYYNLTDNKSDILATVISESGFKTGYAHYTVLNGLGNNRSFRFTSYYYPANGYIHAIDTAGQSHIRVCNGGVWGAWKSIADTSVTQNFKITNDDGSAIVTTGYNLLNITDITSFDGYSESTINVPTGVNAAGYIKRKYKSGHVEVTYSPYNTNAFYRNTYNAATKAWTGWDKIANISDLDKLISDTGWISYSTVNGVLANTAFKVSGENGYNCAYRKITSNGIARLLLRVNISNITTESGIFANLPNNIVVNSQTGVARTNGANQKTVVTLRPSGDLSINIPVDFKAPDYVYHQFEWTL